MNTDRRTRTDACPPLLALGEADAAVCGDGSCAVPPPTTGGRAAE